MYRTTSCPDKTIVHTVLAVAAISEAISAPYVGFRYSLTSDRALFGSGGGGREGEGERERESGVGEEVEEVGVVLGYADCLLSLGNGRISAISVESELEFELFVLRYKSIRDTTSSCSVRIAELVLG